MPKIWEKDEKQKPNGNLGNETCKVRQIKGFYSLRNITAQLFLLKKKTKVHEQVQNV